MDGSGGGTTRRQLLKIGLAGASGALLPAMTGLAPASGTEAAAPQLPPRAGAGRSVLILGAGVSGLTAAYLLRRAGFECRVLEAQTRPGGRNLTARRGTVVTEQAADGSLVRQECAFDEGLYLNLGPGRLPYHHRRVLRYCQELGVELEPFVMGTTANLTQSPAGFGGRPQSHRRLDHDSRGHLAALLAKAVTAGALDADLDGADRANVLELLRAFGSLREDNTFAGTTRSGYAQPLTVRQTAQAAPPAALKELLGSRFWRHHFYQPVDHLWQPTMFQPVGGMDRIVDGFTRKVGDLISYGHQVQAIRVSADGVEVSGVQGTGTPFTARADYCLSSIPLPVLQTIATNFSADFDAAVRHARFAPTCKVGWQAQRRFWESDANQIYGGISWIDHNITQFWYPSGDYQARKGTLTGAYNFGENALALGRMTPAQRLASARAGGRALHPEMADEGVVPTGKGISIAWHRVPFQLGGWALWSDVAPDRTAYARLLAPDRRFHVFGDQVSPLPAWQEGAVMSAEYVVGQLTFTESSAAPDVVRAPDSRALTEGEY
jgi:monoamine oxidase